MKQEQKKMQELKDSAKKQKEIERQKILTGLRRIDDQEAHIEVRDSYRFRIDIRYFLPFVFCFFFFFFFNLLIFKFSLLTAKTVA